MKGKISALSILFLTLPAALFARGGGGCGYDGQFGHMGPHFWGGFYGGGIIMGIVTLILLGVLLFFGIKYFRNNGQMAGNAQGPLDILKSRYAKGEITKEEFDAMKKDIS
ncbi:MAG TPA: SHOCT domain-containing protein [Spirochaetota bacterium]|nr:SHOCT domain-containing protein [Spirochaetota bacterium]